MKTSRTYESLPVLSYISLDSVTSTVGASQVIPYIERIAEAGLEVRLHSFENKIDEEIRARLVSLGVQWCWHPYGRQGIFGGISRVIRAAISVRKASLIHARSDLAAAAAMLAGARNWVWDIRSLYVDQKIATGVIVKGSLTERVLRFVERKAATKSSRAIVLTESVLAELDNRYEGMVSRKATLVTTCVDTKRFSVTPLPSLESVRVLIAGTLNHYYDVPSMIRFYQALAEQCPTELIVATPDSTSWDSDFAAIGAKQVSVSSSNMPQLIASCHVGLSLCRNDVGVSLSAAMPTKIGEFFSCGRPIVVNSGLIDAARFVSHWDSGVVFDPVGGLEVEFLAKKVKDLLRDPQLPNRCRQLAIEHFDLERGVTDLIGVYCSLAGKV